MPASAGNAATVVLPARPASRPALNPQFNLALDLARSRDGNTRTRSRKNDKSRIAVTRGGNHVRDRTACPHEGRGTERACLHAWAAPRFCSHRARPAPRIFRSEHCHAQQVETLEVLGETLVPGAAVPASPISSISSSRSRPRRRCWKRAFSTCGRLMRISTAQRSARWIAPAKAQQRRPGLCKAQRE